MSTSTTNTNASGPAWTPEDDLAVYCAANNRPPRADAMAPEDHVWAVDLSEESNEPVRVRYQNSRGGIAGVATFLGKQVGIISSGRHWRGAQSALKRAHKEWEKRMASQGVQPERMIGFGKAVEGTS